MPRKWPVLVQILSLFVLPILLILMGVIPLKYRFFVLLLIAILVLGIIFFEKWTLKDLGIRIDNLKKSLLPYFYLTIVAVFVTVLLAKWLKTGSQPIAGNIHFQFGFIILSFLQELLFRSFLIPKLKRLTSSSASVIISNAILFGFLHIIFPNPVTIFVISGLLGLGFAFVYYFRPNLILATISHSIINFVAVYYCFASLSVGCVQ